MLIIKLPEQEFFDQSTSEFLSCKACTLKLEHSLISISKWEEKWKKPFLTDKEKTTAEFLDYMNSGKQVTAECGVHRTMHKLSQDAIRITMQIQTKLRTKL